MGDMIDREAALIAITETAVKWGVTGEPAILIATKAAIAAIPAASSEDVRAGAQAQAREAWRIAGMVTNNDEAMQVHQAICALFKISTAPPALIPGAKP